MKCLSMILFVALLLAGIAAPLWAEPQEKWVGVDEAVIEKYAEGQGRQAAEPLFNVEGDMLLFLFAFFGAVGGFIMGYFWHKVFVSGRQRGEEEA